ncbi:MAG: aldo/keto reductase [Steroidobacteraceae bacterium]
MQYTRLGNSGLIVSRLAFGAMTFTAGKPAIPSLMRAGPALAAELVSRALDAGVTLFDTADVYAGGESETLLGAALKPHRRKVLITTKVGVRMGRSLMDAGLSRRHILSAVDASLRRLDTDWIDVYVVHRQDPHVPLEETLVALDDIVRAGKVRYLGFSNWSAWTVAAALEFQRSNGLAPFTHGQMYYSLLGRDLEREVLPMMRHYGLGLTVWSPLAFGFLTGKYRPETLADPEGRYSGFDILPFDRAAGFALVERMRGIAARHGASVAQVALAWLLAKDAVSSVILGATKLEQLDDNLAAARLALTAEDLAELDAATPLAPSYPHWCQTTFTDRVADEALAR